MTAEPIYVPRHADSQLAPPVIAFLGGLINVLIDVALIALGVAGVAAIAVGICVLILALGGPR